jgi:hypothetical protein
MIHLTVQQLSASLDGALTGPSLELVVRHLAACHDCRDRQARLAKHDDALRRLMGQEPTDIFLDDLTRRAEALATAIARGMPAPVMVTSVPLLHEEDPFAPVEPPPLPPRPELGKSGQMAKEAGWGRIGVKPTASTQAPQSDPEEAQRMLEALASGSSDDFTELTSQGPEAHTPVDGPVFDLPAWIKDQSGMGKRPAGPREVPKLDLFFEDLHEHAPGMTREAMNEAFRRDSEPEQPGREASERMPEPHDDATGGESVPAAHAAYAPPGWSGDSRAREDVAPADGEWFDVGRQEPDAGYAPAESAVHAPAGWEFEPPPPADPAQAAWAPEARHPGSPDPGAYPQAFPAPFGEQRADLYPASSPRRAAGMDPVAVLAIATVAALFLIVLTLQLVPAASRTPGHANSHGLSGGKFPQEQVPGRGAEEPAPAAPKPHVRTAESPPPVDQIVPQAPIPVPSEAPEKNTPAAAKDDAGAMPAAREPGAATTTANTTHAPAEAARPATEPAPSTAHDAAATPAAAGEETEWPLLCGQITDESGGPIVNARVSMAEISFATRTDARGRFCVSAPAGTHALLVESSGFAPQHVPVTISSSSMDVRLVLHPAH